MNTLRKCLTIVFPVFIFIFSASVGFAQNRIMKAHPMVINALGQEHVNQLIQQFPDSVRFYNFLIENSFTITQKENLYPQISYSSLDEISIDEEWINDDKVDFSKFNVLKLSVKPDASQNRYYKIKGTNQVLLLRSMNFNLKKFEGYLPEK